jgi:hypothetical protein
VSRLLRQLRGEGLTLALPVLWFFAIPVLNASEAPAHLDLGVMLYLHVVVA